MVCVPKLSIYERTTEVPAAVPMAQATAGGSSAVAVATGRWVKTTAVAGAVAVAVAVTGHSEARLLQKEDGKDVTTTVDATSLARMTGRQSGGHIIFFVAF